MLSTQSDAEAREARRRSGKACQDGCCAQGPSAARSATPDPLESRRLARASRSLYTATAASQARAAPRQVGSKPLRPRGVSGHAAAVATQIPFTIARAESKVR